MFGIWNRNMTNFWDILLPDGAKSSYCSSSAQNSRSQGCPLKLVLPPCPLHKSYGCGGRIGGGWLLKGGFSGRPFLRQKTSHQLASQLNHCTPPPSEYAPHTPHPTTASLCNWRTVHPQTKTCNLSPAWRYNWLLKSWNSWYVIGCRKWWLTNIQSVEIYTAGEICRFDWGSSPPEVQQAPLWGVL